MNITRILTIAGLLLIFLAAFVMTDTAVAQRRGVVYKEDAQKIKKSQGREIAQLDSVEDECDDPAKKVRSRKGRRLGSDEASSKVKKAAKKRGGRHGRERIRMGHDSNAPKMNRRKQRSNSNRSELNRRKQRGNSNRSELNRRKQRGESNGPELNRRKQRGESNGPELNQRNQRLDSNVLKINRRKQQGKENPPFIQRGRFDRTNKNTETRRKRMHDGQENLRMQKMRSNGMVRTFLRQRGKMENRDSSRPGFKDEKRSMDRRSKNLRKGRLDSEGSRFRSQQRGPRSGNKSFPMMHRNRMGNEKIGY